MRALGALWDTSVDTLWSIALALEEGELEATLTLASLRESMSAHAPGLDPARPWTEQAVERLYLLLAPELAPLSEALEQAGPARAGGTPVGEAGLAEVPRALRAVFVFHLIGGLGMAQIAALLGADEDVVRGARAWVSYRLLSGQQEGG